MATSDPVQGTTALHQHVWNNPGAAGALIPTHMVCGAMGDVPYHPVLAQVRRSSFLCQQHWHSSSLSSLWDRLQIWVSVPKILETSALQTSGALQPERVGVPCITGTYSRLWVLVYEEVGIVFVFLTVSFLLTWRQLQETAVLTGEHYGTIGWVSSSNLTFPQEKKIVKETSKQEWADMCTMVWKGHSENLQ